MRTLAKIRLPLAIILLGALALLYLVAQTYFYVVRPRSQFEAMLKSRVSPEELRTWAIGVLDAVRTNGAYGKVSLPVHPALVGLYANFKPQVYAFKGTSDDSEHLMVDYEAGHFGSWGLEIGQTNRSTPTGSGGRHYTPWAQGICFFSGPG